MLDIFLEFFTPLGYNFMQRALFVASFISIACAIFSCFLVLKGWALLGDAISHAVLPGVGLAVLIGIPISLGAFFAGISCVAITGFLKNNSRIKEDAAMGIVFSGMFAVGVVLAINLDTNLDIFHILFGNILGVSDSDFIEIFIISAGCTLFMLLKGRDLFFHCFDIYGAISVGIPVKLFNAVLFGLLALLVVSALKSIGILLAVAMLITPGAIGFLMVKSFYKMLAVSVFAALFASLSGVLISFHINAAPSATIVLIQSTIFFVVFLLKRNNLTAKH